MSYRNKPSVSWDTRRGSALIMCAGILALFVIFSAYVINLAYIELTTTQLHVAADAVARATGRTFIVTGSQAQAIKAAETFRQQNRVATKVLESDELEISFGKSVRDGVDGRYNFSSGTDTNAVRVTVQKSGKSASGALKLLFPTVFSVSELSLKRESVSTQVDVDIALVVDRSGSMAYAANEPAIFPPLPKNAPPGWNFGAAAPSPSRWRDLVLAVDTFAQALNKSPINARLAIVSYSTGAVVDQGLTDNILSAPATLSKYSTNFHSGATDIGAGLQAGGNSLKAGATGSRTGAVKVIILMTDGIRTAGLDPVPIAKKLANDGALIFTITFSSEADQKTMISLAHVGNGRSFHAVNAASLEVAFFEIARQLPTLITR